MTFQEYEQRSQSLRLPSTRQPHSKVIYPALKLAGEAGEVAEKIGKLLRGDYTEIRTDDMLKELGDVLWYVTALAEDFGATLEEVAIANIEKLESRAQRGVLSGSGDHR